MGWSIEDRNYLGHTDDLHGWTEHALWVKHVLCTGLWDVASQEKQRNSVTKCLQAGLREELLYRFLPSRECEGNIKCRQPAVRVGSLERNEEVARHTHMMMVHVPLSISS